MTYAKPHFLVDPDWLEAHLGDAGLRIIDCRIDMLPAEGGGLRFVPATNAWKEEHIPGATFVDFHEDLSDREHTLLFMLPSAQQFAEVMSRHGVGDGTRVVLYDGFMNAWAARLWWMLRTYGFDEAAVLNGGWHKWKKEGRQTSSELSKSPTLRDLRPCLALTVLSTSQQVLRGIGDPGNVPGRCVDTRPLRRAGVVLQPARAHQIGRERPLCQRCRPRNAGLCPCRRPTLAVGARWCDDRPTRRHLLRVWNRCK